MEKTPLISMLPDNLQEPLIAEIAELLEKRNSGKSILSKYPENVREALIKEVAEGINSNTLTPKDSEEKKVDAVIGTWAKNRK